MNIGITGGVGTGKSTVMAVLKRDYGFETLLADDAAAELEKKGRPVYEAIVDRFGNDILGSDGEIDRKKLAAIVFRDRNALKQLNSITHPAVKKEILKRVSKAGEIGQNLAVEAALLIEEHYDEILDELWYVDTPEEIRIQRLMASRGYTREKCLSIIGSQLDRDEFIRHCDRVIVNDGDMEKLKANISSVLEH